KRLIAIYTPPEEVDKMGQDRALKEKEQSKKRREIEEEKQQALTTHQLISCTQFILEVDSILKVIRENGPKVHEFLESFLTTRDPSLSSQASKMLVNHGPTIFDAARRRQPEVANDWALLTVRQLIEQQSKFSPLTSGLVKIGVGRAQNSKYKNRELILATFFCMLTKSRSEHSTSMQTTMCMYLLACGASRSLFDILSHAGITLSYTQAILKDNINFAFKVEEQRHDSKDHFDNGTTATLVTLFGVDKNTPPLPLKPPRTNHIPILDFTAADLMPSPDKAARVQDGQLWHIKDMLYDAFPDLRKKFSHSIPPPPVVQQIPVHKTE
ncbi:hypothetical protein BDN70DRAFT_945925, partial [Pholiota conissans]